MTLKEQYIEMRKSNQISISWFWQYYCEEFEKIPQTYNHIVKDITGSSYLVEFGFPGNFINQTEERKRERIDYGAFQQTFHMWFQFNGKDILEVMDKKMGVTKTENENGELIYIN